MHKGKPPPRLHAPRQVRIIGGKWKRTPLPVLEQEGLRPTPDRVRETVFNWLNHLLDSNWSTVSCLDLFAGTGALGFEAASRGAKHVLMIDEHAPVVRQLETTKAKLKAEQVMVQRADAIKSVQQLTQAGTRFDVLFLDPPYHRGWLEKLLPRCDALLTARGLVYAEAEQPFDEAALPAWLLNWEVVRADKAGTVFYHLLQRKIATGIQA